MAEMDRVYEATATRELSLLQRWLLRRTPARRLRIFRRWVGGVWWLRPQLAAYDGAPCVRRGRWLWHAELSMAQALALIPMIMIIGAVGDRGCSLDGPGPQRVEIWSRPGELPLARVLRMPAPAARDASPAAARDASQMMSIPDDVVEPGPEMVRTPRPPPTRIPGPGEPSKR